MTTQTLTTPTKTARVFKRLGAGAFLFFALKGIIWLTVRRGVFTVHHHPSR